MKAQYESCFWAWVGMLCKDQGIAEAHEALDELLDAARASSPVVQTDAIDLSRLRRLTHTNPKKDQQP